jgi:hypothetical protein
MSWWLAEPWRRAPSPVLAYVAYRVTKSRKRAKEARKRRRKKIEL